MAQTHGTKLLLRPSGYYFRYIIRPCHRPLLSIKELRYTLNTSSRRLANTSSLWLLGIMAGLLSLVGIRKLRKA